MKKFLLLVTLISIWATSAQAEIRVYVGSRVYDLPIKTLKANSNIREELMKTKGIELSSDQSLSTDIANILALIGERNFPNFLEANPGLRFNLSDIKQLEFLVKIEAPIGKVDLRNEGLSDSLLDLLNRSSSFTGLSLSSTWKTMVLDREKARRLGTIIASKKVLRDLSLSFLSEGREKECEAGVIELASALALVPSLQTIHLGGCHIGDGAKGMADLLFRIDGIRELSLLGCGVNDAGVQYIAAAIEKGSRLERLYLSSNNIGSVGVIAIAKAIEHARKHGITTLGFLNLDNSLPKSDTDLSKEAFAALREMEKTINISWSPRKN